MPGAAILPTIDYVDYNDVLKSENAGYERGKDQLSRNTMATAGQALAKGDYKGAKNAFYSGGDVAGGLQIQQHIEHMDDRQREAAKRISTAVGNIALGADTPEKWNMAVQGLKARGMDVSKYGDFSTRDAALAESGMMAQYLERADKLRQEANALNKPIEIGGRLVKRQVGPDGKETYGEVYAGAPQPKPITIVPDGASALDANGKPIFTGAGKRSDLERRAEAGGLKPGTPEYQDYILDGPERSARQTELERRAQAGGLTPGTPEYQAYVLGGPPKAATEKWNGEQSKAANFGNMMVQAERKIETMGPKDKTTGKPRLDANGNPVQPSNPKGLGGMLRDGTLPFESWRNSMTAEQEQVYKQAAEQWIRNKLRKESGAAIGKDEMEHEFQTYFPQIGDGPKMIAQKAESRSEATRGMIAESAGAYKHFFGENEAGAAGPRKGKEPSLTPLPPGGFPATKRGANPVANAVANAAKGTASKGGDLKTMSDDEILQGLGIR